jgi:hypothetical protein
MDELKWRLIEGHKSGCFLKAVAEALRAEKVQGLVAAQVSTLHNSGVVDVVAAFEGLENRPGTGIDFFLTADVFRSALPTIESPVEPVMVTVAHLYKAAGTDLAAGFVFEGFIAFIANDPARPAAILRTIEADPNRYADLLPATLVAKSRSDADQSFAEAIRLLGTGDIELKRRAAFAMGRLAIPTSPAVLDAALASLENAAGSEKDRPLQASIIKSAVGLLQHDKAQETRVLSLVDSIVSVGDDRVLHAASEILASTTQTLSTAVSALLLGHLQRVKPENQGTVSHIDFAISRMLIGTEREKGLEFIESYLLAHLGVELQNFSVTTQQVASDPKLVGTLLTRWFLRGDHILCSGIAAIVRDFHGKSSLEADPTEIEPRDSAHIVFLARKTVGYLFLYPVPAARILVSLMRQTDDDRTLDVLGALLQNPLLVSYPGSAAEVVAQETKATGGKVKATLEAAHKGVEDYLQALKSMPDIPALHPSEEQREAQHRRRSRLMARSYKEAQKESVFFNLIRRSVLLYGEKSVYHVQEPGGQSKRIETPLKSFGTSFDLPRLDQIDPVGLDIFLRTCKSERIGL